MRAARLDEEALALFREVDSDRGCDLALSLCAFRLFYTGREDESLSAVEKILTAWGHETDGRILYYCAVVVAAVAARRADAEAAARLIGVADSIIGDTQVEPGVEAELYEETVRELSALGWAVYDATSAEGRAMSPDDARRLVLTSLDELRLAYKTSGAGSSDPTPLDATDRARSGRARSGSRPRAS